MADDNFDNWEDDDGTGGGDYVDDGTGGDGDDGDVYDDQGEADGEEEGGGEGASGFAAGADQGDGGEGEGEALYDEAGNLIYAGEEDEAEEGGGEQHDNGEGAEFDDGGGDDGGDQSYDQDDDGAGGEMGHAEDDGGYPAVIEEGDEDAAAAEEEEESGVDPVQEARMAALDAARQRALSNIRSMSGAFKPAVPTAAPSAFSIGAASAPTTQQSFGSSAFRSPSFAAPAAAAAAALKPAADKPKTAREKKKELKEQKLAAKLQQQQTEAAAANSFGGGGRSNSRSIVPMASAFGGAQAGNSKEQAKADRAARFASTNAAALAAPAPSVSHSAFGSHSPSFSPSPSPEFGSPPAFIGGRGSGGGGGRSTASLMAAAMGGASDDLNGGGGEDDLFGRQAEHYTPIVGQCLQMCPTEEQQARQESRDLSYFEIIPGTGSKDHGDVPLVNPSAAVKKYKRAAAAQTLHAKDVRPPHILQQTMSYLVSKIMDRQDSPDPPPLPPFLVVYRFVSDRMRALRQDFACQGLKDAGAVRCYEIMVRFHILTMFECGEIGNLEKFDPTPNMEKLSQTLTSLRHMYFDNYAATQRAGGAAQQPFPTPNEAEMHSYRLLVDLDRRFGTLYEELDKFDPAIKSAPIVQLCVQIYNAFRENNWVRFFALARKAPYLHAVLLQGYFNKVRTRALEVLSGGCYKSYPFDSFQSLLAFESPRHAVDFLKYHGIELDPKNSPGVIQFKPRGLGLRGAFQAPQPGATPFPFRNSFRIVGPKRPKLVSQAVQAAIGRGEGLGLEAFIPGGALAPAGNAAGSMASKLGRAVKLQQQQQQQAADSSMDGGGFAAAMAASSSSAASAFGSSSHQQKQPSSFNALARSGTSVSNLQSAFGGSTGSAFAPSASSASAFAASSPSFALPPAGVLESMGSSKPAIKLNRAGTGAASAAIVTSSAASIAATNAAAASAAAAAAASASSGSSSLNAKAAPFVPKTTSNSISLPAAASSSSSSSAFAGAAPAFGVSAFSSSGANVGFAAAPSSSTAAVFGGTGSSVSFGTFGTKPVPAPLTIDTKPASTVPTPPLSARGAAPPALQVPAPSFGATTAAGGSALPSSRAPLESGQTEHIAGFQLTALPPSTPRASFSTTVTGTAAQQPSVAAAGLSRSNAVSSIPPPHPRPPLASSTRAAAGGFDRADSSLMIDVPRHTPSVIVSYKRQTAPPPAPQSPTPEEAEERFLTALRTYRTSLLRKGLRSWHASSLDRLRVRAANERAQRALEKRADVFVQVKFFLRWHEQMREHQLAQIRFNQAQENLHQPIQLIAPMRKLAARGPAQQQQLLLTSGSPPRSTALMRTTAAASPSGVVSSGLLSPYGKLERLGIHVAVVPALADEEEDDDEQLATEEEAQQEAEDEYDPASGQLDFDVAADDEEQDQAADDDGPDAAQLDDANDADYVPPAEGEEEDEEEEVGGEEEEEAEALDGSAEADEADGAEAGEGEGDEEEAEAEEGEGDEEAEEGDAENAEEQEEPEEDASADSGLAPMDMSDDPLAASAHAKHAQRLIHGSPARVGRSAGVVRLPLTPLSASASAALKSPTFVPRVSLLFTSPYTPSRSPGGAGAGAGAAGSSASGSHKRSRQALEVDAFLESLTSPGSRMLPAAPAPTPATAAASSSSSARRAQNQPAATFDSSHVPLLYDDDSASEGGGLDADGAYGYASRAAPSSATRAKLFHTPSTQSARAVFSPPQAQPSAFGAAASLSPYPNPTFAVGAALDAAASAASPSAYLRPRLSFGTAAVGASSHSRFHSPAMSAPAASMSPPVSRVAAGDLLHRVSAELQQSSKLDQLMQQLEYRYAAQI